MALRHVSFIKSGVIPSSPGDLLSSTVFISVAIIAGIINFAKNHILHYLLTNDGAQEGHS